MAAHGWSKTGPLSEALFEEGYRFSFYQAVRLLEILYSERRSVGEGAIPEREAVRFTSPASMVFPAGDIDAITAAVDDRHPATMAVFVMGLAGAFGPLPAPYAELIAERRRHKDTALAAFLDIFNHRLVSLLYRVRKIFRVGFDFRPPDTSPAARTLFSLIGMGTADLRGRSPVRDWSLLAFTAMLGPQPRSMHGLEVLLKHHFRVPITGRHFCGRWLRIGEDQQTILGLEGANQVLGDSAVLGGRVWDQQGKFRIDVGPLPAERFLAFLPGQAAFTALCELIRFYVGPQMEFDILLKADGRNAPALPLGPRDGPRLGWTSWLWGRASAVQGPVVYQDVLLSARGSGADLNRGSGFE